MVYMILTVLWIGKRDADQAEHLNLTIYRLVFLWLAVPWLQTELDHVRHEYNRTPRRANKNKVLPQTRPPEYIRKNPHKFDIRDFKVCSHLDDHNRDINYDDRSLYQKSSCKRWRTNGPPQIMRCSSWCLPSLIIMPRTCTQSSAVP